MSRPWVPTALETTTKSFSLVASLADSAPPIVKQIFLVATRISEIAETINKNRDALHDLKKRSVDLAKLIDDTLGGRKPGERVMASLEKITEALVEIEVFMENYRDMKKYKKLWTNFAKGGEVTQLKDNLLEARKNFKTAAALDTNIHVVETHRIVKADAQFHGSILNLHDAEVDKDDGPNGFICKIPILPSGPDVLYFRASVRPRGVGQGQAMVLRIVDRPSIPTGDAAVDAAKRIEESDKVLIELTAPACQHRYVAKIFGRSDDETLRRFTVLNLDPALISGTKFVLERKETNTSTGVALKLMDAAAHLNRHDIDWVPQNKDFHVNLNGEPIIGLDMDLHKRVPENAVTVYQTQMDTVFVLYENLPSWEVRQQIKEVRYRLAMALRGLPADSVAKPLSRMVAKLSVARKVSLVIPKSDFTTFLVLPNLRLNGKDDYLLKVNTTLNIPASYQPYIWARIMSLLARGTDCTELRADYCPSDEGDEIVIIWLNAGRLTRVWLDLYHVEIPDDKRDEFRRTFNITPELIASNMPSIRLF